jgi:hypothetical protein
MSDVDRAKVQDARHDNERDPSRSPNEDLIRFMGPIAIDSFSDRELPQLLCHADQLIAGSDFP